MQHIWKVLLTSLLIFALAATACLAEDSEAQYQAYSYTTFSLRRTPSESDRGITVRKKTKILILEWDDAWCKVQVGNKVGYAKPEWLYRVQSLDALHYPLQNLPHRMSGYVEFSQDTLISGGKFKGCTASAGQIACVEAQADGAYLLPVWRGEMQLTDEIGTYHPFADWETAEPGDIIGGFTTFYGDQQGHGKAAAREHNISEGVKRIDGVAVEREETFSFNALCAPYRHSNGYELAPNVSTDGFGYGGGVCQVTTTLYNAALTLPLQIEEWALHSKQGAVYVPQFFGLPLIIAPKPSTSSPPTQSFEKKRNSSALFAREINLVTQPSFDCEQGINSQVQTACSNADAIFPVLGIVSCRNERFSLSRKTHVPLWNAPRISHVRLP